MKRKISTLISPLLLMASLLILTLSCKKEVVKIPELFTTQISALTGTTALGGGYINRISDKDDIITERGVCWSINRDPTIADNKTSDGTGSGSFTSTLTGLTENTIYYVRAYATNSAGTGYGNTIIYFTNPILTVGLSYLGGIIAYINQPSDQGYVAGQTHGLIAAPADTNASWDVAAIPTLVGSTATSIGSGFANTVTIVTHLGITGDYAALYCFNSLSGGYNDWYLPSSDELNKLYHNRTEITGFSNTSYWSSSEKDAANAWTVNFNDGSMNYTNKNTALHVRAVRTF
jgi:hypothetical protein